MIEANNSFPEQPPAAPIIPYPLKGLKIDGSPGKSYNERWLANGKQEGKKYLA